jgi:hypothetical protein
MSKCTCDKPRVEESAIVAKALEAVIAVALINGPYPPSRLLEVLNALAYVTAETIVAHDGTIGAYDSDFPASYFKQALHEWLQHARENRDA